MKSCNIYAVLMHLLLFQGLTFDFFPPFSYGTNLFLLNIREAGFHILITSYQLLVTDEKYLRRVKWQYMVLDEAQAIKSSNR